MSKNNILHVVTNPPVSSNRLTLQLQYTSERYSVSIVDLSGKSKCNVIDGSYVLISSPKSMRVDSKSKIIRFVLACFSGIIRVLWLSWYLTFSKCEVLHAHENPTLPALVFWKLILRRKAIWDPHDYFHETYEKSKSLITRMVGKFYLALESLVLKTDITVICVSEGMRNLYESKYGKLKTIKILNYSAMRPVDWQRQNQEDCEVHFSDFFRRPLRLVYAGQILEERIELGLIETIGRIDAVELDIWGADGRTGYSKRISEFIRANGLRNIKFMGRYKADDLCDHIKDYDFAIIPYPKSEKNIDFCLPNKFFQYLQAGLPLITSNLSEIGSLVSDHNLGYVFKEGNYDELERVLKEIVSTDCISLMSMKKNIKKYNRHMICYESQAKLLCYAYDSLINQRSGGLR